MKISDTLTNQKKELEFSDKVRIYLCGVTVYDQSHIGHARTIIIFDTLRRFLEANGTQVELIQNFTDVDDKIMTVANDWLNAAHETEDLEQNAQYMKPAEEEPVQEPVEIDNDEEPNEQPVVSEV